MKKNNIIRKMKNQRGVALIFALGILGLMVVLGLTFASLSFTEQKTSRSSTERFFSKILAKSAINHAVLKMENDASLKVKDLISKDNKKHYDFLWKLITKHGDVPGPDKMYKHIGNRVIMGNESPYWVYVEAPDENGDNKIVGRFAYIAYKPMGLLDPVATAMTGDETTSSAPVRYGVKPDEIDLTPLVNVKVDVDGNIGSSGKSLSGDDVKELGKNNKNSLETVGLVSGVEIITPAELIERFTDATKTGLVTASYNGLKDKLTSAWFSVPRPLAHNEKFVYDGVYYHRFNINRSPEEWAELSVNMLTDKKYLVKFESEDENKWAELEEFDEDPWKTSIANIVGLEESSSNGDKVKAAGITRAIPWFFGESDHAYYDSKKQMAANFLAYFSPMPKSSSELVDARKYWDDPEKPKYTANMRTPYLNDIVLDFAVEMSVDSVYTDENGNPISSPAITGNTTRKVKITLTPKLQIDFEMADLYGVLGEAKKIKLDFWGEVDFDTSSDPIGDGTPYSSGDLKFSGSVTTDDIDPENSTQLIKENEVFSKHLMTSDSWSGTSVSLEKKITLTYENGILITGGSFTYEEALNKINFKDFKVRLHVDFGSGYIPVDFAYLTLPTEAGGTEESLGNFEKQVDSEGDTIVEPFHLEVSNADDIENLNPTRRVVLHFKAKDPAANLRHEDWVWANKESPTKLKGTDPRPDEIEKSLGVINWSESNPPEGITFPTAYNKDNEIDLETTFNTTQGYGGKVSTSYIRGRYGDGKTVKMQSPWEIGFIHRGRPFQTFNIKKFKKSNPEVSGTYKDGDANIFDQLKYFQPYKESEIKMAELTAVSGLVNVNDVSSDIITDNRKEFKDVDINKGNLYAAKALFSNIQLGWELPGTDDKFAESGSALDSTRIETLVVELARMNLELGLKKKGMERRSQLLDDDVPVSYDDGGTSMIKSFYNEFVKGTSDAALEELPGKVIMLTTTENMADELGESIVVVAIAQSIQINTNAAADKDWLQNGEFDGVDLNGYSSASSEEAKLYQKAMMESGYGYREYDGNKPGFVRFAKLPKLEPPSPTSTNRLETFYPGYDKILSTQKVVAWLRKNPTTGEWHIERLDYVD